ncbi:ClbS/DfsB family four-helix bundle protein [Massilibacteroides sp.]|uniref:ClbS/DfsB family four-helix bundle protein n=1 Tax=Massilibacteroides sp. TaxID=2034766 RepID=UPI0026356B6B|nr:ClbS/DfsB family four-helix bundle protein [Massilibacteroides sp.]MDD4515016.1 ClbS/DfsB family four-helix bundle protein [Massilibacteroides sp.]
MGRATTKTELISAGEENFGKLFSLINSLTETEQESLFEFEDRDRNIRDVLVHLYEWHQLLLKWVTANQMGKPASFLPEPYNWKTYPQMNIEFWEKHQKTSLDEAVGMLNKSHMDVMSLISGFSDGELFTKKHFSWTGTTSLGSYCVSATSSHYDWAIKKIKMHKKSLSKT